MRGRGKSEPLGDHSQTASTLKIHQGEKERVKRVNRVEGGRGSGWSEPSTKNGKKKNRGKKKKRAEESRCTTADDTDARSFSSVVNKSAYP